MTEAEWLSSNYTEKLLNFLNGKVSNRKLRLFSVGCCKYIQHLMPEPQCQDAVSTAERFADGLVDDCSLSLAADVANRIAAANNTNSHGRYWAARAAAYSATLNAHEAAVGAVSTYYMAVLSAGPSPQEDMPARNAISDNAYRLFKILRFDIFGNPFRFVSFNPKWRTSGIFLQAQRMYDSRDFCTMPILSDALQDAGCENEDIMNHCRSEGPHVRGCWVVDLILGKE